jgi:hypothetical protein
MGHHPSATYHLSIVLRELGIFKVCDVWRVWRVWRVWASCWTPGRAWTSCAHGTGTLDVWQRLADVWQTSGIRLAASGQRLADVWQTFGSRLARAQVTTLHLPPTKTPTKKASGVETGVVQNFYLVHVRYSLRSVAPIEHMCVNVDSFRTTVETSHARVAA